MTHEMIPVCCSTGGSISKPVAGSTGLRMLNSASDRAIDSHTELSASSLPGQILCHVDVVSCHCNVMWRIR